MNKLLLTLFLSLAYLSSYGQSVKAHFGTTNNPTVSSNIFKSLGTNAAQGVLSNSPTLGGSTLVMGVLRLPHTTNSSGGVLYKDTTRFLHDYSTNTADGFNIFLGKNAGNFTMAPTGGLSYMASQNIGIGDDTLQSVTWGYRNIAIGWGNLKSNTIGYHNVAVGGSALARNISGIYNTAVGISAMQENVSGDNNTAYGGDALLFNTTGSRNVAAGRNALYQNTNGTDNVAIGFEAMYTNFSGLFNTAIGAGALNANSSGGLNTAAGRASLVNNTIGEGNVGVGDQALYSNRAGTNNVAVGSSALHANIAGGQNTAIGAQTFPDLANTNFTGNNTAIGYGTGGGIVTGVGNTIIGANVTGLSDTLSNNVILAAGNGAKRLVINSAGLGVMTTVTVNDTTVAGLSIINPGSGDNIGTRLGLGYGTTAGTQTGIQGYYQEDGGGGMALGLYAGSSFADKATLLPNGVFTVPAGYAVGAAVGLTTNISVLIAGGTTNQLQFTKGILTGVVPQ